MPFLHLDEKCLLTLRKVQAMSEKRPSKNQSPRKPRDKKDDDRQERGSGARRARPSRGSYKKDRNDEPNRGKSRENDRNKGQTRRNSLDSKKPASAFKVSRVKGKERELVWDSDK